MKPSPLSALPMTVLLVGVAALSSLATVAAQKRVQKSTVYEWTTTDTKPNEWGAVRQVMRTPTPTLDELEIHITTLNPGATPHAPHKHPDEELLIVKEGTVESLVNGELKRVGPGSIIFQAANQLHSIRNVGDVPATYHVIKWNSPGMLKAR